MLALFIVEYSDRVNAKLVEFAAKVYSKKRTDQAEELASSTRNLTYKYLDLNISVQTHPNWSDIDTKQICSQLLLVWQYIFAS